MLEQHMLVQVSPLTRAVSQRPLWLLPAGHFALFCNETVLCNSLPNMNSLWIPLLCLGCHIHVCVVAAKIVLR